MISEQTEVMHVGIADLKIAAAPLRLRTAGLGSCVGVVVYDQYLQLAGMAHVMLPDSEMTRKGALNRNKYADTALEDLISQLLEKGARKSRFKAKLAGGAQMFSFMSSDETMRIGPRNIHAVEKKLADHAIPITASDLGGTNGRTIEFNPITSELKVKTVNKNEVII